MENKNSGRGLKRIEPLLEKRWIAYTMATCSAVLLYFLLVHLQDLFDALGVCCRFVSPIISGIIIAYLINPVVNFFEKKLFKRLKKEKTRHSLSVILAVLVVLTIFTLLLITLIPSLIDSFAGIAGNLNNYLRIAESYADHLTKAAAALHLDVSNLTASSEKLVNEAIERISANIGVILSTSYSIGTGAANFVIGFILAVYFLLDKEHMLAGLNRLRFLLLKEKTYKSRTLFWSRCHKILGQYIFYDLLDGLIVGVVNAVLMLLFGMPYIALVSVVVGMTNLLPTFGPIIGALIGGLILVLNDPIQALIFLIFTVILQFLDGYILKPRLFGGSLGVPAVWILIMVIVGGKMFGIAGILLAIPFTAIFTFVYEETILPFLEQRRIRRNRKQAESQQAREGDQL